MPGFDGTGPHGMGPMTGGGRGFCAVPLPPNWPILNGRVAYHPYRLPFVPQVTREQELDFLKTQAQAMRGQLKQIETSIHELEGESKL